MRNFLALLFFLILQTASVSPGSSSDGEIWRTSQREPANALYSWLRLSGIEVSYDEIVELCDQMPSPVSLLDLRDAAREKGANVVLQKGHTNDIIRNKRPVLVYLEGTDGKSGYFASVIMVNKTDEIIMIEASTARLTTMPGDKFRRIWTGHYLTLAPEASLIPWLSVASVVILVVGIRTRFRRKRND